MANKIKPTVVTIDPSNSHCGYAIWDYREWCDQMLNKKVTINPIAHGVAVDNPEKILSLLKKMIGYYNIRFGYIEDAAVMDGVKGHAAARSGKLIVLAEFIGMVQHLFSEHGVRYELVSVQRWKGTMSKTAVNHRIKKHCPYIEGYQDSWDAIGIGLYLTGVINQ